MKLNNLPKLKSKRISLRKALTPAEAHLWKYLQNSQLEESLGGTAIWDNQIDEKRIIKLLAYVSS